MRDDKLNKAFGQHLKKIREAKKLTQAVLAVKCEIARSQIIRMEQGERAPTLGTLFVLAKGLEVDPKKLLDFDY